MKNVLFTLMLAILSSAVFAQTWKPVKIDDSVQVSIPGDFERKDTLGQTLITARSAFGNILITIQPDNPKITPDIEKLKHLQRYYDDFVENIKNSSDNGVLSGEKDTLMGKLRVKDVTLAVDSGSGKQLRHIRILHENGATYTFQFLYQDIHAEYAAPESESFFNSIKIPPDAGLKTQFTEPENTTGQSPTATESLLKWIAIGVLLLLILYFIIKRVRR